MNLRYLRGEDGALVLQQENPRGWAPVPVVDAAAVLEEERREEIAAVIAKEQNITPAKALEIIQAFRHLDKNVPR